MARDPNRQIAHARGCLRRAEAALAAGRPGTAAEEAAWGLGAVRHARPGQEPAYTLYRELLAVATAADAAIDNPRFSQPA